MTTAQAEPEPKAIEEAESESRPPGNAASSRWQPLRWSLGALVVSRIIYWSLGLRFDVGFANRAMQVVDLDLLKASPFSTVWFIHIQPPLFNLFVGLGAKLFGPWAGLGFQALYLGATVIMLVSFVRLCLDLGAGRGATTVVSCFLAVSPTIAQYENILFYTHLEIVLVVVAARCLQRWCLTGASRSIVGFSASLSALALGRSLYHPLWFIGLAILLLVVATKDRRRVLAVALAVPLVCGLAVGAKNAAVFGWWTTGSFEGLNLHRVTEPRLNDREREDLIAKGVLTQVSIDQWSCTGLHPGFTGSGPDRPIPVLDRTRRRAAPDLANLNNRRNVKCFRALKAESLQVLRHEPRAYARSIVLAVPTAFYSTVPDVRVRPGNQRALARPGRVESLLLGAVRPAPSVFDPSYGSFLPSRMQLILLLGAVVVPGFLAWSLLAGIRSRDATPDAPVLGFVLYAALTGVVLTQLTEVGENNRLMLVCWPMLLAGAALMVSRIPWRAIANRAKAEHPQRDSNPCYLRERQAS